MLINRAAIDYLRITTDEFADYEKLAYLVMGLEDKEPQYGRFLQYEGTKRGAAFHGQAVQNDKLHYLAQISGAAADGSDGMIKLGRCTRIDLQITIDKPADYDARALTDCLRSTTWAGRRRKITLIDGGGEDTIYIGSRTSEVFIRLYVKNMDYLRFEIEYKGDMARKIAAAIGQYTREDLINHELNRLPICPRLEPIRAAVSGVDVKLPELVAPEKVQRLKWLSSLLPTFAQMANDHDYGETVRNWFYSLSIENGD